MERIRYHVPEDGDDAAHPNVFELTDLARAPTVGEELYRAETVCEEFALQSLARSRGFRVVDATRRLGL